MGMTGRVHMSDLANCIRFLTVDAIMKANSGHVGMCLGLADVMTILFREILRHNPKQPQWNNRDRVVLSNGHGSMLLYSALYLSGYDWTIEELKQFRQLGSCAAGHPELDVTKGVEVSTGPLGQGLANALGMAIAKERLNALYPGKFDYTTYCFVGDGCLMEGISHEVGALAPTLIKSGLVVIWDDNGISIDGKIEPWFEKNVLKRFSSYGFEVIENIDGHNEKDIKAALLKARSSNKPCFIQMKTIIGKGCQEIEGDSKAHGQPLNKQMVEKMRKDLNWKYKPFDIPEALMKEWLVSSTEVSKFELSESVSCKEILWSWCLEQNLGPMASRKLSSKVLQELYKCQPHLIGGSADLTSSNLTGISNGGIINQHNFDNPYIAYGVREFGMFAIANGLALSGLTPYVGTFLTFVDYGKNALRMAALMKLRVVYVLTHDSIGLGEDGPTHQPVEQLIMCRATPGVELWRPCNLEETTVAWIEALSYQGPSVLALSRQTISVVEGKAYDDIAQGAYLLVKEEQPDGVIFASGSEVPLALEVAKKLKNRIKLDVISVPSLDRWESNPKPGVIRVKREHCFVIEAGSCFSWLGYASKENIFSVDGFGFSASKEEIYKVFGLTVDEISNKILRGFGHVRY